MLIPQTSGNIATICAQHARCCTAVRSFIAELGHWFTCLFEGILKSLLITWWILSLSLALSLSLSLSLWRQNVAWTATHFVAFGWQCVQGTTKCAVWSARFVADDKLCRGDKMCRNSISGNSTLALVRALPRCVELNQIWVNSYSASHDNWCTTTLRNRIMTTQCEGIGEVGLARYEPALLLPCPSIKVLSYSNCQENHSRQQTGLAV